MTDEVLDGVYKNMDHGPILQKMAKQLQPGEKELKKY